MKSHQGELKAMARCRFFRLSDRTLREAPPSAIAYRRGMFALLVLLLATLVTPASTVYGQASAEPAASTSASLPGPVARLPSVSRVDALIASVTIFVLAVFVGFEVITKVPPTLHTPLMSGSNAISGITLVGALLAAGSAFDSGWVRWLGAAAVVMATVNVVGGFLVTHRMLAMFRRK